jgi:hypothetical protein
MSNIAFGLQGEIHPNTIPIGNNFHFCSELLFRILARILFNYLYHKIAITNYTSVW